MKLDRGWTYGVMGWCDDSGRHVRLADIVAAVDDPTPYVKRHLNALLLLNFNLLLLRRQLEEAMSITRPKMPWLRARRGP